MSVATARAVGTAAPVAEIAARAAAGAVDAALEYAERGFRVFPLRDSGDDNNRKLPQHKGWPEAATSDAETIRRWWDLTPGAGIGIATGDGLLVLDVDNKNGKNGDASLAALLSAHGEFPATLSATTPNGGTHYYLRGPDASNSVDKLGVGLDVRGHHGYVVAPSPARCGVGYTWRNAEEIADAPRWLIGAATSRAKREPAEPSTAPAMVDATLAAEVRSALNALDVDNYDDFIFAGHATYYLGAFGREAWTTWAQQSEKWRPEDARRWETFAGSSIGYQALFARAQRDGWHNPNAGSAPRAESDAPSSAKPIPPGWRLQRVGDLLAQPRRAAWLARGILEQNVLACLFGPSGTFKSFVAVDMTGCMVSATPWHGHAVKQGPVVYMAGEGHHGLLSRYQAWAIANGVDLTEAPLFISSQAIDLGASHIAIAEAIEAACGDVNPVCVVVDTLHRHLSPGADENDSTDMGALIAAADHIRQKLGCTVLIVHHSGHAAADRERGSSALRAAMDWAYSTQKSGNGQLILQCRKAKDHDEPEPMTFALETVTLPTLDEYGEPETSAVLRMQASKADARLGGNQFIAMTVLRKLVYAAARSGDPVTESDWREATNLPRNRWGETRSRLVDMGLVSVVGGTIELLESGS